MHVMKITCVRQVGATVLFTLPRLSYQCGVGSACTGRQFSASPLQLQVLCMPRKILDLTMYCACDETIIFYPSSRLDMAVIRFAKTQLHKFKLLYTILIYITLATNLDMDLSQVLHPPQKLKYILETRCTSIAPVTQNDCRHVVAHI